MSDVEKNRSTPKAECLERLTEVLHLDSDEKAIMYDLVGKQRDSVAPHPMINYQSNHGFHVFDYSS